MKIIKMFFGVILIGLILLGIVYNFIVPCTPVWFDVLAGGVIIAAFIVVHALTRKQSELSDRASNKNEQTPL